MSDLRPPSSVLRARPRLAFIVSHPIQYYVPLYRRLAQRSDLEIKLFFTWHDGSRAVRDPGFQQEVAWDIPLTEGYGYEAIPNRARDPGTHHFWGVRNPELVSRVLAWKPDVVHLTGYSFASHLHALRSLHQQRVPVLFRGDSHLLDERQSGPRWLLKRWLLRAFFQWPSAFLCVGRANKDYYRAFGVPAAKLLDCPHSVETVRFAEPDTELEQTARAWRKELGVGEDTKVLLFAGKFEDKKRPLPLMRAFLEMNLENVILLLVGDGEFGGQVRDLAAKHPARLRVLPFQNQSRMPLVYRLGDIFVLPSSYGETWGLAVNEAMACGRPALVSDRVGCAQDLIRPGENGGVFRTDDWLDFRVQLDMLLAVLWPERRDSIRAGTAGFSTEACESALFAALHNVI